MGLIYLPTAYINETRPVDEPKAKYFGIPICLIRSHYIYVFGIDTLKSAGLREVYRDLCRDESWYTKGTFNTVMVKALLFIEHVYWCYFLRVLLYKKLHLITRKDPGREFSWHDDFILFQFLKQKVNK